MASGSNKGDVALWDRAALTGATPLEDHTSRVGRIALSPDGRLGATAASDGTAKLWDLERNRLAATLRGHGSVFVEEIAFFDEGRRLITTSNSGRIAVWDVAFGEQRFSMHRNNYSFSRLEVLPDGQSLLAGAVSGGLTLWNLEQGGEPRTFDHKCGGAQEIDISRDGQHAVSCDYILREPNAGGQLMLWDLSRQQLIRAVDADRGYFTRSRFTRGETEIVTTSSKGDVDLWRTADLTRVNQIRSPGEGYVSILERLADGRFAWITSKPATLCISEMGAGQGDATAPVTTHHLPMGAVSGASFSEDGRLVCLFSREAVLVIDVATGACLDRWEAAVSCAQMDKGGHRILAGSSIGAVFILERS